MYTADELVEKVFAEGNLVHGTSFGLDHNLDSFLSRGITTGRSVGRFLYTPDILCLGLLKDEQLPQRYLNSSHYGPKIQSKHYCADDIKFAFIISREAVLASFPNQVFAVGSAFWSNNPLCDLYSSIRPYREIYNIPVQYPGRKTVLEHEVRIYPRNNIDPVITREMMLGVVMFADFLEYIKLKFPGFRMQNPLPVFTPQCEFIEMLGTGCAD